MARNYIQQGNVIAWTNNTLALVAAGLIAVVGLYGLGVALVDIAAADTGSVQLDGVFELPKATGAVAQGGRVWWDYANAQVLNAPAKNAYFLGYAFEAAASGDTTAFVYIEDFCCEGPRILTLAATGAETLGVGDFTGGELTLLVPNTAAKTINLPAVATIPTGAKLRVRKTDATAAAITLDPNSSETIAGGATHTAIDALNDTALFQNNGTAWILVDSAIA